MPISSSARFKAKGNYFVSKDTSTHNATVPTASRKPNKTSKCQNKKVAKDTCSKKKVLVKQQRHPLKLLYSSNAESYISTDTECSKYPRADSVCPLKESLEHTKNGNNFMWRRDKKRKKGGKSVNLKVKQESGAYVTRKNNYDVLSQYEDKWSNYITERRKEIISQYDAKQSREIISHILTKSVSSNYDTSNKTSCSTNTLKKPRGKHCNVFKIMMHSMSRKLKLKNSGNVKKPNDVIVLHVPKKFSNISVEATTTRRFITPADYTVADAVPAPKEKKKKLKEKATKFQPLKIRDSLSEKMIYINRLTKPPNKLCGRGEIFVHNQTK